MAKLPESRDVASTLSATRVGEALKKDELKDDTIRELEWATEIRHRI